MRHAFVDVDDKTMCSRCGNEVVRVDEECPAVSDGEMYKRGAPCVIELCDEDWDEFVRVMQSPPGPNDKLKALMKK